jgi:hypothetical protein
MSLVNIVPVEIPQSPIIETSVRIIVLNVELNVSANIDVQLLNSEGNIVDVKHLTLSQPDYSLWGTDDEFIVNWSLNQLGLTKQ